LSVHRFSDTCHLPAFLCTIEESDRLIFPVAVNDRPPARPFRDALCCRIFWYPRGITEATDQRQVEAHAWRVRQDAWLTIVSVVWKPEVAQPSRLFGQVAARHQSPQSVVSCSPAVCVSLQEQKMKALFGVDGTLYERDLIALQGRYSSRIPFAGLVNVRRKLKDHRAGSRGCSEQQLGAPLNILWQLADRFLALDCAASTRY
jgi:hypothetical protein